MAGPAQQFVQEAPSVLAAEAVNTDGLVHYYQGEVESTPRRVRISAVAPDVTDQAVHDAFFRAASAWYNTHTHPNVVTVYEHESNPRPWIAVEFVDGNRLSRIRDELSVPAIRQIIEDAADAIRNASLYNTHHLSLSPETLWVVKTDDGFEPRLDDWGLERACHVAAGDVPTALYTAPELQTDPEAKSEQADVYSLGAVAYYALTGEPPSGPATANGPGPVALSAATNHPDIDESVDNVIQTALAEKPEDRYESAYAFLTAISRVLPTDPRVTDTHHEDGVDSDDAKSTSTDGQSSEDSDTAVRTKTVTPDTTDQKETDDTGDTEGSLTRRATLGFLGLGSLGAAGLYLSSQDGSETVSTTAENRPEAKQSPTPTSKTTTPGGVVWSFDADNMVSSSPAVMDGTVYIGSNEGIVHALEVADGTERWGFQVDDLVTSSPAVVDGTVYVGSRDYTVYALDAADGSEQWTYDTGGAVGSSPAVVDGTVYVGSEDNTVYALDAADGTQQWTYDTDSYVFSSPAVVDGTVYIGSWDDRVYALDAIDGTEQWTYSTRGAVNSSPAVVDGTVYVGNYNIYALDASDGTEQWSSDTAGPVDSSAAVVDGTVYVGSNDNSVYAFDATDGTEQWAYETGDWVQSSPAVVDGTVYVGSNDGNVYALDAIDGTEQWTYEAYQVKSSPAVVNNTVYTGSGQSVYALATSEIEGEWRMYQHNRRNTG